MNLTLLVLLRVELDGDGLVGDGVDLVPYSPLDVVRGLDLSLHNLVVLAPRNRAVNEAVSTLAIWDYVRQLALCGEISWDVAVI